MLNTNQRPTVRKEIRKNDNKIRKGTRHGTPRPPSGCSASTNRGKYLEGNQLYPSSDSITNLFILMYLGFEY